MQTLPADPSGNGNNAQSTDALLGSCSVSGSPSSTLLPVALALLGLALTRKRRR